MATFGFILIPEGGAWGVRLNVNSYWFKPNSLRLGVLPKSKGSEVWGEGVDLRAWWDDAVCSQISAVLSTPLWEWVLQRFGKRTSAFGICVSEAKSKVGGG